jgi:ABC-type transporter Mla subunit MlaD
MIPEERLDRLERIIEKQNDGIKDLIRVGRILTDAQQVATAHINEMHRGITRLTEDIAQLRDAQKETGERLNILIDTVDRIVRRNGKEPPHEG